MLENEELKTNRFEDLYRVAGNILPAYLEKLIYSYAENLSNGLYNGGFWKSEKIENTKIWFFSLTGDDKNFLLDNQYTQKKSMVSNKCFSLICMTFALSNFINVCYEKFNTKFEEEIYNLYYGIKRNANLVLEKKELEIFYQIID